jgi:hypothetical protein
MRPLLLAVVVLEAALLVIRPALTAPAPGGAAVAAVSGYRISDVSYLLDAAAPGRIAAVSFTFAPADAQTVRVRLGSSWSTCSGERGRARCRLSAPLPRLGELRSLAVLAAR